MKKHSLNHTLVIKKQVKNNANSKFWKICPPPPPPPWRQRKPLHLSFVMVRCLCGVIPLGVAILVGNETIYNVFRTSKMARAAWVERWNKVRVEIQRHH